MPHPPILRRPYILDGERLLPASSRGDNRSSTQDETGEIYLKLASPALDLADPEAILAFVNEYGILGVRYLDFAALKTRFVARTRITALRRAAARGRKLGSPDGFNEAAVWGDGIDETGFSFAPWGETIAEFRFAAEHLRDLVAARRIETGELKSSEVDWRTVEREQVEFDPMPANFLAASVNVGLPPGAIGLYVGEAHPEVTWAGAASLYSICCLELFNHVAENATYRTCANETCRRLFVRQEGRAEFAQHRMKGVRFCSERCKGVQKQREYRRRQAKARGLA